jgi:Ca2+-binding RTX toxin-like protein
MFIEELVLTGDANINATGNGMKNYLVGNSGDNVLDGGEQADTLAGGAGNDTYVVDSLSEVIIEAPGEGIDTVVTNQTFSLAKNVNLENVVLVGGAAINAVGNGSDNLMTGGTGANVLEGKGGNDTLDGGEGSDTLSGGAGADHFVFSAALDRAGVDLIKDFKPVEDTIALSRAVFDPGGEPGTLSASAFTVGTGATDALDRIVYDSRTGDLFYDPDGIGGAGKVRFAQLTAGLSLTYEDFILV